MCILERSYIWRLLKSLDPAHPVTDCELVGNPEAQAVDPRCCDPSKRLAREGSQTPKSWTRASLWRNQYSVAFCAATA